MGVSTSGVSSLGVYRFRGSEIWGLGFGGVGFPFQGFYGSDSRFNDLAFRVYMV